MNSEQETQLKQKYLRENLNPEHYQDFTEFFMNEAKTEQLDISKFSLAELQDIVNRFTDFKNQQQKQQNHERSFAIYQTAGLQQIQQISESFKANPNLFDNPTHPQQANIVQTHNITQLEPNQRQSQKIQNSPQKTQNKQVTEQNKQSKSPQKSDRPSASELLDSVLASSDKVNPSQNKQGFQKINRVSSTQSKYRTSSQFQIFQKDNLWMPSSHQETKNKATEFQHFWQFSSNINPSKISYVTQSKPNQTAPDQLHFKKQTLQTQPTGVKKNIQPIPTFEELTKAFTMSKKNNAIATGITQAPTNTKKQQSQNVSTISQSNQKSSFTAELPQKSASNSPKQVKMQNQLVASKIKKPRQNLLEMIKIPYKGQSMHKTDFKDVVKCFDAPVRQQVNDNRLKVTIQKHEIIEKNFFVGDYVMYYMTVKPLNIVCKRNYEDFVKLKFALQKFYPGMQLPWLEKNSWFQTNSENIKKQKIMLEFFINDLIQNPEIRNSRIFEDFLTLKQHKNIKRKFEEYTKMDQFKALEELCITGGKVQVVISEQQRIYHEQVDKMLTQFDDILTKKSKLIETLKAQFVQINETLVSLAKLSTQLSEQVRSFNQNVANNEIMRLESTFSVISKIYEEWGGRIQFQSKLVNKSLVPFYRYQRQNLETMRSLLNTQAAFLKSYLKKSASQVSNDSYNSSSLKSHKNGILQESKNLTVLKYQLGYLGNMIVKENVRFFELMSQNFRNKWIYSAQKLSERLNQDHQFYNCIAQIMK